MRNTLLGLEYSGREILPDVSTRNNRVKIEPDDPKNLTEQLDLSVPLLNNFEEETEDDDQLVI